MTSTNKPTNLLTLLSVSCLILALLLCPQATIAADFAGSLKGVTITDSGGVNTPPTAAFIFTQNGDTFNFDASSSVDLDGSITEYRWDFGDGVTGTGATVSHQFAGEGSFPVTLTTVDDIGGVTLFQEAVIALDVIRVNAGGQDVYDANGNLWMADNSYNTGNVANISTVIAGANNNPMYQSARWDAAAAPELLYSFNVPDGVYTVNLHFAESYSLVFGVGLRTFDVIVENSLIHSNLDVYSEVGSNTVLIKSTNVTVSDGILNIEFRHITENPSVRGFEIIRIGNIAP